MYKSTDPYPSHPTRSATRSERPPPSPLPLIPRVEAKLSSTASTGLRVRRQAHAATHVVGPGFPGVGRSGTERATEAALRACGSMVVDLCAMIGDGRLYMCVGVHARDVWGLIKGIGPRRAGRQKMVVGSAQSRM